MSDVRQIAVLVGSLRKDSFSRRVAGTLASMAPAGLRMDLTEIGQLCHYDQDIDDDDRAPDSWLAFRTAVGAADAVLFVTPEYNRSIPGVLKNALDIGSRPYGQSAWNGKPAAVVSVTRGAMGGFGANHHLRQVLVALNMPTLQHPEAYIGGATNLFAEDGTLLSEASRGFFRAFMAAFAGWIDLNLARPVVRH